MRFAIVTMSFLFLATASYTAIEKRNRNTQLRLEIPRLKASHDHLLEIREELEQEVERFESPQNLLDIWLKERFAHLQPVYPDQIDEEFTSDHL